jgi:hypothetical protein
MPSKHKHPMIRLHSDVADRLSVCNGAIASEALRRYYRILDESVIDLSEDELKVLCFLFTTCKLKLYPLRTWPKSVVTQIETVILSVSARSSIASTLNSIDIPALQEKLHGMSLIQAIALVEKIERG